MTSATGKLWSNGLDLEWLGANLDQSSALVDTVHGLLARVLSLPVPTVAACQGHVFAAGAALAHDSRVMRADRGLFCLPEVDISIPFTAGMAGLIQARLTKAAAHEAMTTGRRYGGEEAVAAGIVETAVPMDQVLPAAVERVASLAGKAGPTLGAIKEQMGATQPGVLRAPAGAVLQL